MDFRCFKDFLRGLWILDPSFKGSIDETLDLATSSAAVEFHLRTVPFKNKIVNYFNLTAEDFF